MIRIKDLSKDWKEFTLKNINIEIKKGGYFVILGPTGAGKTLLHETIAGFYFPDSGEIRITMVHVTHDQTEAMVLADRIAVMMNGQIQQVGTPYEIFNKPLNEEITDSVGVENILHGVVQDNENGIAKIEVDMGANMFAVISSV